MEFNILKSKRFGAVELLTISRPSAMNALNSEFFREINIYLDDLILNEEVSVLIIPCNEHNKSLGVNFSSQCPHGDVQGIR